MKNWIIALAILIIPLVSYYILDKTHSNTTGFEAQASYNKPVVIKFYSPMCLDCKKLEAVIKEVMPKYADKVTYQNINGQSSDKTTEALVQKYNINLVPTMVFVKKDGKVFKRTEGTLSKKELENILDGLTK